MDEVTHIFLCDETGQTGTLCALAPLYLPIRKAIFVDDVGAGRAGIGRHIFWATIVLDPDDGIDVCLSIHPKRTGMWVRNASIKVLARQPAEFMSAYN